jgi:hypothetical protein
MKSRLLAVLISLTLILSGCSASDEYTQSDAGYAPEAAQDQAGTSYESSFKAERSVIRSAQLGIETQNLVSAVTELERLVDDSAGYFEYRSQSANNSGVKFADYSQIRIPNEDLDGFLDELKLLGQVVQFEISSDDVTTEVLDLGARVSSLSDSVTRLEELISSANTTSELLEIENALSQRRAELESLQSQLEYYQSQVDYSTVSLSLYLEGEGPIAEPKNFLEGIGYGFESLMLFLSGTLVAIGFLVPWLLVIAPVALVLALVVRLVRKARKV